MRKKLTLKKEVLKSLSAELLGNVAGGGEPLAPDTLAAAAGTLDACNVF